MHTLITYGKLEIGEVPSAARIEKATPNAIIRSPAHKTRYRFIRSEFIIILLHLRSL
ncbi:MAG: hypothetical protein SOT05_05330 [Anaerovoracaceae bacterium]|nr:hypothetical protein [Anaerovoracaceae bacterium]